jgi:succinyl-CoA synthetase alpha subunit
VGIGGDPVRGMSFIDVLALFEQDPQTEGILMVGEIGGSDEEAAAEYIRRHVSKPVVAYIAGVTAPPGKRMGHAGAVISGGKGTAADKFAALEAARVTTVRSPAELGSAIAKRLGKGKAASKAKVGAKSKTKAKRKPTAKTAAKSKSKLKTAPRGKTAKAKPKRKASATSRKTTKAKANAKAKRIPIRKAVRKVGRTRSARKAPARKGARRR